MNYSHLALEKVFDDAPLNTAYQSLMKARLSETEVSDDLLHPAMDKLLEDLHARRATSSAQEWKSFVNICMHHPLKALLHQDPFTHRAFAKPRGTPAMRSYWTLSTGMRRAGPSRPA